MAAVLLVIGWMLVIGVAANGAMALIAGVLGVWALRAARRRLAP